MNVNVNKTELLNVILDELYAIHKIACNATQRAIEAATDEETIPEHKYDTLALEASYLAHGQALRVQQSEADIAAYRTLAANPHHVKHRCETDSQATVSLASIVTVCDENDIEQLFFVGPCAGGVSVCYQGNKIVIVTSKAPLGGALLGKSVDDDVELVLGNKKVCYTIVDII